MTADLDPSNYWKRPPGSLTNAYWEDPLDDVQGMLSSDLIKYYNDAVGGLMIDPFSEERLKPAAYELTLGPSYLLEGEEQTLSADSPWLTLPPNSIVFVSMSERLMIPHYLVARFNLAIEFVYQGLLLGTGPQVDPGFQGVLSCPLHNISSQAVHIQLGYPFAKMDFAKTSGLRAAHKAKQLADFGSEEDLYSSAERREPNGLRGEGGGPVVLFNFRNRWRQPIYDPAYAGQKRVTSSLAQLQRQIRDSGTRVERFGRDVSRFRRFGLAGGLAVVLAIVAILVTLAQLDRSYTDAKIEAIRPDPSAAKAVAVLRTEITVLKRDIRALQEQLAKNRRPPSG